MRHRLHVAALLGFLVAFLVALLSARPVMAKDTATLTVFPEQVDLAGLNQGRQLLVTAENAGRPSDLTGEARFTVSPPGVVRVSPRGYVRPAGKGEATVTVEAAGQSRSVRVTVRDADESRPLNFANDVVPLLTRHGCNAGGCHGKASGQNGFKLSVFAFDPG